jgi:hypothetical protein
VRAPEKCAAETTWPRLNAVLAEKGKATDERSSSTQTKHESNDAPLAIDFLKVVAGSCSSVQVLTRIFRLEPVQQVPDSHTKMSLMANQ